MDYAERRAALIVKRLVVDKGEAPWQKGGGAGMRGRRREPRLRESSSLSFDESDDSGIRDRSSSSVSAPDAGLWENEAAAAAKELFTRSSLSSSSSASASSGHAREQRWLRGRRRRRREDDLPNNETRRGSPGLDSRRNDTVRTSKLGPEARRRHLQQQQEQEQEQKRRRLVNFCPPTIPLCAARKRAKKEAILKEAKEALAEKARAQAAAMERSEANALKRAEQEEQARAFAIEKQWAKERAQKAAESERLGAFKAYMRSHKGEMVWLLLLTFKTNLGCIIKITEAVLNDFILMSQIILAPKHPFLFISLNSLQ